MHHICINKLLYICIFYINICNINTINSFWKHIFRRYILLYFYYTEEKHWPVYSQYFTKQCGLRCAFTPPAGSRGDSSSTPGGHDVKDRTRAQEQCDRTEHPETSGGRTGRGHSRPPPHDHRERQPERETQGTRSSLISSTLAEHVCALCLLVSILWRCYLGVLKENHLHTRVQ